MRSPITKHHARAALANAQQVGLDPYRLWKSLRGLPVFIRALRRYSAEENRAFPLAWSQISPRLADHDETAGTARGHYFHQDLWAARKIFERRPAKHIDVGSRIDGFIAHLLTFMPVTVLDVRPIESDIPGLSFQQQDATTLSGLADGSIDSLSSLHAIEHFGLGRYGDPIDPNACFSAMSALSRVLAVGGRLYFSVPIGVQRVEFNAQRVFAPSTVLDAFGSLRLVSFAAVDDDGNLVTETTPASWQGANYACGLFEFTKD